MKAQVSLEQLVRSSARALVIGVGGGGDVVGALAVARFLEFCGLEFRLGGLSWERSVFDPVPGPRSLSEVEEVRPLHPYAWLANPKSRTFTGVPFAESKMAEIIGGDILLIDIHGGVDGVVDGLAAARKEFQTDLLVGVDVGGDSLAQGDEPGLRSPLADSIMLAAYAELERRGERVLWAVFGYGSDGEMTTEEIEIALYKVAQAGGLLGAWGLTNKTVSELEQVVQKVPTEASAIPVECARGAWGEKRIRQDRRRVKLTPLTTLTFFMSPGVVFHTLSRPAQALRSCASLEEANEALHSIGLKTELDLERERFKEKERPG
ncbi:MAG: DUF1152 domain-containing protein [Deltaproteobacteria bacterium]|nr:DUF1152 domain-containing protein [Deltaproteobacteria bacterium]